MISSVHLRALVVAINIAAATLVLASPLPPFEVAKTKRAVNCPATDSAGSALTGSSADPGDEFATCAYQTAGECTYFFANGSFSSGSSACPAGLQQDAATTAATGTVSSNVNCPATDKEGTALTASSDDSADEFATCTYQGGAGECTYFFASGDFSSGSSNCPAGLPQTAATTSTTATEATTSSILSVPQATTSSTAATTSTAESPSSSTSTVFSTLTSSSVFSTLASSSIFSSLTSFSVSASTPDSAASTSTDAPTTPDTQTPAPAAQTTFPDASEPSTTDVTVTETFAPTDTPSPVGAAAADSNAALSMRGCTTAAVVRGLVVPFGVVLGMILM